ncbi:MAG: hypothetical protein ICV65_18785 [Flavisolibacter sp.]|nr:hypothetical protein [Flavisolibacter sp.]
MKEYAAETERTSSIHNSFQPIRAIESLQRWLVAAAFFNLFLVSCLGVLLRVQPFLNSFPLQYKNMLHGHSHFAFGGWVMPVLLSLMLHYFPDLRKQISYTHWRNIALLLLLSAYGMLFSFPFQGYKAVSISFSTVSVIAGFYMAVVVWRALAKMAASPATQFLKWGLIYLSLSAIGPFATGPLVVMGYQGTPLYYNAVYFFLHFQYNGWFTFAVLALLYKMLEEKGRGANGRKVFWLFNSACVPAYFLSTLWMQPSPVLNWLGGLVAVLQLAGVYYLLNDVVPFTWTHRSWKFLFYLSITAFVLKNMLQLASAFPAVAIIAYGYKNFVIAYLHLVLLGFISLFAFGAVAQGWSFKMNASFRIGLLVFLIAFTITELILVAHASAGALNFYLPHISLLLFLFSIGMWVGLLLLFASVRRNVYVHSFDKNTDAM